MIHGDNEDVGGDGISDCPVLLYQMIKGLSERFEWVDVWRFIDLLVEHVVGFAPLISMTQAELEFISSPCPESPVNINCKSARKKPLTSPKFFTAMFSSINISVDFQF